MTTSPRVSVIVPHYNDLARLDHLLTTLERQTPPAGGFEIVVADNASPVPAEALSAAIADRARLTTVPEKGAGPTRNGGVAIATGDLLAFTDSDCVPQAGWMTAGLAGLDDYDIVGGSMTVLVDDPDRMTPVEAFERVFAFNNKRYVEQDGFTVTANLFCTRKTFDRVGGFTTSLVSEDIEWCHRARAMGLSLGYVPEAGVGHPARRTWEELVKKTRRTSEETFGLAVSKPGGRLRWLARTLATPFSAIVHTPKVLTSKAVPSLSSRFAAVGILFRIRFWRFRHGLTLLARGS